VAGVLAVRVHRVVGVKVVALRKVVALKPGAVRMVVAALKPGALRMVWFPSSVRAVAGRQFGCGASGCCF
jgi:hypothetical protein